LHVRTFSLPFEVLVAGWQAGCVLAPNCGQVVRKLRRRAEIFFSESNLLGRDVANGPADRDDRNLR
jgi:hypothetical protein